MPHRQLRGHGSTLKTVRLLLSNYLLLLSPTLEVTKEQLDSPLPPIPEPCDHIHCGGCYSGYPQSLFPNWTEPQVKKSGIFRAIEGNSTASTSILHRIDVDHTGIFTDAGKIEALRGNDAEIWEMFVNDSDRVRRILVKDMGSVRLIYNLIQIDNGIRLRAMFIENISGLILQMLGTKYASNHCKNHRKL